MFYFWFCLILGWFCHFLHHSHPNWSQSHDSWDVGQSSSVPNTDTNNRSHAHVWLSYNCPCPAWVWILVFRRNPQYWEKTLRHVWGTGNLKKNIRIVWELMLYLWPPTTVNFKTFWRSFSRFAQWICQK